MSMYIDYLEAEFDDAQLYSVTKVQAHGHT